MALIKCPECEKEYSDTASQCQNCGYREINHSHSKIELWKINGGAGKEITLAGGYEVKKIFDANYGEVNTYHREVWEAAYPDYEI